MKYARDSRPGISHEKTAQLLFEALPWIKHLTGKTIVIKYGGAAMVDPKLRDDVMSDIVLLKIIGVNPVIVHGGGADINAALKHYDIPVEFKDGQRVTSPEAMEIVREVLVGKVNQELVADYIPVVATVAAGEDGGFFNINADVAAGHIAAAVHAHKAIFLTDVDGLYEDFSDKDSLISNLTLAETQDMLDKGEIDRGMIPKLQSCIHALRGGVFRAHIINGTTPHSLLLELLTDTGVGTVMHSTEAAYENDTHPHPLGVFASRLVENLDE